MGMNTEENLQAKIAAAYVAFGNWGRRRGLSWNLARAVRAWLDGGMPEDVGITGALHDIDAALFAHKANAGRVPDWFPAPLFDALRAVGP